MGPLIGMRSVILTFSALNRLVVISSFYFRYILYAYANLNDDAVIHLDGFIQRISFGVSKNENTHQIAFLSLPIEQFRLLPRGRVKANRCGMKCLPALCLVVIAAHTFLRKHGCGYCSV